MSVEISERIELDEVRLSLYRPEKHVSILVRIDVEGGRCTNREEVAGALAALSAAVNEAIQGLTR